VLAVSKKGSVLATPGNVKTILVNDPRVRGSMAFNVGTMDVVRLRPWTVFDRLATVELGRLEDIDISFLCAWLQTVWGLNLKKADALQGIEMAARAVTLDPVRDGLLKLGRDWDGVKRLRSWLVDFGMIDDTGCPEYVSEAGIVFMVGAVKRAFEPGCEFHTALTIEGEGGGGKSNMFQMLADAVGPDLFTDSLHDVSNTVHVVETTEGKWIAEIAELDAFKKANVEVLKRAMSVRSDRVRKPYAIKPVEVKRRWVFVATTNERKYITDPKAQGRRFLPVRSMGTEEGSLDREVFKAVAGQLLGEAVRLYQSGFTDPRIRQGTPAWVQWKVQLGERLDEIPFEAEANKLAAHIAATVLTVSPAARALAKNVVGYRGRDDSKAGITALDAALAMGMEMEAAQKNRVLVGRAMAKAGFTALPQTNGRHPWHLPPERLQAAACMLEEWAKESDI
jgi:predicted P-loop ATPase